MPSIARLCTPLWLGGALLCAGCFEDGGTQRSGDTEEGDDCESSIPISAVPYEATHSTTPLTDDFSFAVDSCPEWPSIATGVGARDLVYQLTPTRNHHYSFRAEGDDLWDLGVYVHEGCGADSICVEGADSVGAGHEIASPFLRAGQGYSIVIDGLGPGIHGAFDFNAFPAGDACTTPVYLDAYIKNRRASLDDYLDTSNASECGKDSLGFGHPDTIYRLDYAEKDQTPGEAEFVLQPADGVDLSIYALKGICGAFTCDHLSDVGGAGVPETIEVPVLHGETIYVVVDGGETSERTEGLDYELSLTVWLSPPQTTEGSAQ